MDKVAAAKIPLISNSLIIILKLVVGLSINSVSIIAEAIHSGLDLLAAIIAYLSVKEADKPADREHPYGHAKIENLSGSIEALLIFAASAWIVAEAIGRLRAGMGMESGAALGMAVMALSAGVNWVVSARLLQTARATESIALEADALHLRTDVWTSLGVFTGLGLISLTGIEALDPLVAIAVALFILRTAYRLTRDSLLPLLDISLPAHEQQQIDEVLSGYRHRYVEVHMLRTRKAGGERHIDLHLVLPKTATISEAHALCDEIEDALAGRLPNSRVLIHVEPCDHREDSARKEECPLCEGEGRDTT